MGAVVGSNYHLMAVCHLLSQELVVTLQLLVPDLPCCDRHQFLALLGINFSAFYSWLPLIRSVIALKCRRNAQLKCELSTGLVFNLL